MKKLFPLVLFLTISVGKINAQSETDSIPSKVIFYMPDVNSDQLDKIKTVVNALSEITDAAYISGNHKCLVVDIDKTLGENLNYYSDLTKRLSVACSTKTILIKAPSAFTEIMMSSEVSIIQTLK